MSIPAIPTIPNNKTINSENDRREKESINNNGRGQTIEGIAGVEKQDNVKVTGDYTHQKTVSTPPNQEEDLQDKKEKSINWKTYPYNSNDTYTLKNRANKVAERVLSCTTSNELNKLIFLGKVTEVELNWLVQNYLTQGEKDRLNLIRDRIQGNLFSTAKGGHPQALAFQARERMTPSSTSEEVIELEFEELIEAIDVEMKRIGWSESNGQQHLMDTYGKKSRRFLTDEELLAFWDYLKEQKEDIKK